jgi:hypothetical protein
MPFVPLPRGPRLAKGRTREDALAVRPDATADQIWEIDGLVRASRSIRVAPLERVRTIRPLAWTVSESP